MRISYRSVSCVAFCTLMVMTASRTLAQLVGTQVTGALNLVGLASGNFFDPNYNPGFPNINGIPSADLNSVGATVIISPTATEFGAEQSLIYPGPSDYLSETADFTANTLTVSVDYGDPSTAVASTFTFTDPAFTSLDLVKISDTFSSGLANSLIGDTITLTNSGLTGGTETATFSFSTVPEPTSMSLILAIGGTTLLSQRARCAIRINRQYHTPADPDLSNGWMSTQTSFAPD